MLVALVTRNMRPGAKFDFMPIFEGPQGIRKSTAIKALAGMRQEWATEIHGDFGDPKKFVEHTLGKIVIEVAELSSLLRGEVNALKAMLSVQCDRVRLSYERRAEEYPRRGILIGSTNDDEYLRDATGGRRNWPVKILVAMIDTMQLLTEMPQLHAEAFVRFVELDAQFPTTDIPLHLTGDAARKALVVQEDRRINTMEDDLAAPIQAMLDEPVPLDRITGNRADRFTERMALRTRICATEIRKHFVGDATVDLGQSRGRVVNTAFRHINGWEKGNYKVRINGVGAPQRVWYLKTATPDERTAGYRIL